MDWQVGAVIALDFTSRVTSIVPGLALILEFKSVLVQMD